MPLGAALVTLAFVAPLPIGVVAQRMQPGLLRSTLFIAADVFRACLFAGIACLLVGLARNRRWRREAKQPRDAERRESMIADVCRVPLGMKAGRGKSFAELVRRSGYLKRPDDLTVEGVARCLREHPELVEAWLAHSADKRASSGWYVRETGAGRYEMGYHPGGPPEELIDGVEACAPFIVRELADLAAGGHS